MREVSRVQMVFRVFIHVILRMCVTMLRLLINKFSLAIFGVLIVVGAIVAAISMAPPQKSLEGQVEQHSMEELTVQFSTAPLPLSLPFLHVSSYDIQWTSVGTGESWTTQGEITISGVTEGTDAVSYTVKGLDPERVYRFRTRGKNLLGAGPWSDWFPSNGLVPGPGPTPTPEPTATPTPTPTPQTETNTVYFNTDDRPTVGESITAQLTLSEDAYTNLGDWQWQISETALSDWTDITGLDTEDTASYTPVSTDVGSFLRVYVTYTDEYGILKRGLSPTIGPVQE
ncbi:MAG: hypothetical protein OXI80_05125 [Caldilineaceae bacterium]|nr:hypothetical protein [Caldilineaceae bacterium]MDE0337028.1 hypothetical protein [Caldilineaceae bacterium]